MLKWLDKILVIISCGILLIPVFGQQDAQYNQYMYNQFFLNPAYSGNRNDISAVVLHRSQWVGFNGAPMTETFSINSPLSKGKIGIGLQIINDRLGSINNFGVLTSYAYKIKLDFAKLSFGLRPGFYNYGIQKDKIDVYDTGDLYSYEFMDNKFIMNMDFGTYLVGDKWYLGITFNHLNEQKIKFNGVSTIPFQRHILANAGYTVPINEKINVKPSVLIKYTQDIPVNVDLNSNFEYDEKFSGGFSYRTSQGLVMMFSYRISNQIRAGYSFDLMMNSISKNNKGTSHEVYVGYEMSLGKNKMVTPRHL